MFRQFLPLAIVSLSPISSGMHYGWTSVGLPQLSQNDSHVRASNDEAYWISASYFGGNLIGCFLGAFFGNNFGQKNAITFSTSLLLIAWIVIACASSVAELIIARIACGTGEGLLMCSFPAYIAEIAQPSIRGFMLASPIVTGMLGIILINVIGTFANLKITALIALPIPAIATLLLFSLPESPYRLVSLGKVRRAKSTLQQLRNTSCVEEELERISSAVGSNTIKLSSYSSLFTDKYNRKTVYICFGLVTIHVFSGNSALIFHTQRISEEAGGPISSWISSLIYLVVQLVFMGLAISFVDKVGRRPLLIFSTIGATIALFVECVYFYVKNVLCIDTSRFDFAPFVGLVAFVVVFSLGLQIIPSILAGELFAPNVKSFALSLYEAHFSVISMVALKLFQFTYDNFGFHVSLLMFTLFNLLGFFFIYYLVPETKQKTLEQIQVELRGQNVAEVK